MSRLRHMTVAVAVVVAIALAAGLPGVNAASAAKTKRFDQRTVRAIDAIVSATKNGAGVPGMVVGVWDPKRGTLLKGYGTGNLAQPASTIASDDHVRIASITKSFTATAILQLVAKKQLALDAHLSEFVSDIPNGDTITVAQLMNMTAGVFSYTEDETFLTDYFADPQSMR